MFIFVYLLKFNKYTFNNNDNQPAFEFQNKFNNSKIFVNRVLNFTVFVEYLQSCFAIQCSRIFKYVLNQNFENKTELIEKKIKGHTLPFDFETSLIQGTF